MIKEDTERNERIREKKKKEKMRTVGLIEKRYERAK